MFCQGAIRKRLEKVGLEIWSPLFVYCKWLEFDRELSEKLLVESAVF